MISIQFPSPDFRIKKEADKDFIFDKLRKKWLLLTPEEWVRQNFVRYLIEIKNYPASLIALEKEIQLGELKKRFDILIYNKDHKPWMMIECKGPEIKLNDAVLQQVLRYNISLPAEFIIITNGSSTYGWQRKDNDLVLIDELPVVN
ncbi:MAG: type I restriction enzyme HsdR N-terminal domain-containing protein [Bacteroidia bacterium]|nr:type I restriction enzyme HsdR N-terminal domain-containing protein [Bacteroidia bacterium]